ncbi:lipocalin family protein [Pontiella sulfatireligans]|uniref:Outer membrane lipoprotein Blc n=1 Tax=Pontiella sulfatireligans TaxID=2750658 RepID=A0A6C2ULM8_9BACT|nr:lipocalin family protein [Pontiella sulfatireligans]VGO21162.1 Outer membrane lipoprotein Blc [Pontiella sulfatireligans]
MKTLLALFLLVALSGCRSTANLKVVDNFEVDRYLGRWYEVARYPHGFEKDLSSVTADYSFNDNGTIKVLNRGFHEKKDEWKSVEGVAKFKGEKNIGWLKVSFFKPFYASYKILYLSSDYREAIIGGPTRGYLWILSREPVLPQAKLDDLVSKAQNLGYNTEKLLIIDQSKNKK